MRKFIVLFLIIYANCCFSQSGFEFVSTEKKQSIPFESYNNLIIIDVKINNVSSKFILDTGVKSTILTEPALVSLLNLSYDEEVSIQGAGEQEIVLAMVSKGNKFQIGDLVDEHHSMLVLIDDFLELPAYLGFNVHGIIGADVFNNFTIEIDYFRNQIHVYEPGVRRIPKRAVAVPLMIVNGKPYVRAQFHDAKNVEHQVNLLIDTGASHSMLLELIEFDDLNVPEDKLMINVGRGLAGDISGYLGRIHKFELGGFLFENPVVSFTESYSPFSDKRDSRQGTIGGEILSRFHVIFDYSQHVMYLYKGAGYKRAFEFNMGGIDFKATGVGLNDFEVVEIFEESPAFYSGLLPGDKILKMNGVSHKSLSLNRINQLMRTKPGKKIRLKIERDGEVKRISFRLKRLI